MASMPAEEQRAMGARMRASLPMDDEEARRILVKRARPRARSRAGRSVRPRSRAAAPVPEVAAAAASTAAIAANGTRAAGVAGDDRIVGFVYADSDGEDEARFQVVRRATQHECRNLALIHRSQPLWKVKRVGPGGRQQPRPVADDYIRAKFIGVPHLDYARSIGLLAMDERWGTDEEAGEDDEEEEDE